MIDTNGSKQIHPEEQKGEGKDERRIHPDYKTFERRGAGIA